MSSKGPKSKLDHETRARRQKALEAPKEPSRPSTHWDYLLKEMAWLATDFKNERKWKLNKAKKVAARATKDLVGFAFKGERKLKEEEQRMRKISSNISKDVKKFWAKIEKLVLYKHQLENDEKKKKALDKQLEFLLGQTERYSTMLAENLVQEETRNNIIEATPKSIEKNEDNDLVEESKSDELSEDDYSSQGADQQLEDDERTLEEDEALITDKERQEELEALQDEAELPIELLLKRYHQAEDVEDNTRQEDTKTFNVNYNGDAKYNSASSSFDHESPENFGRRSGESDLFGESNSKNDAISPPRVHAGDKLKKENICMTCDSAIGDLLAVDYINEKDDVDFVFSSEDEKDDEATLSEEEKLAEADASNGEDEIKKLQKESEIPLEELLARYRKDSNGTVKFPDYERFPASEIASDSDADDNKLRKRHKIEEFGPYDHLERHANKLDADVDEADNENRIEDAAAAARLAQPTGNTFLTTKVRTKFPFLLKYPLREYQHIGLDWLVTMYEKRLNGILADEMGLGKTIMTISLLAHLACEKGIWGPHLIVVPTSVMLNWETEFLKWCPAFKILTYFGSAKERKFKRQGWLKPNFFHVCITTYRLVIQDSKVFKRKKWKYLILDEAHLIKNWKSQRWQTLLNFNSKRRILLTGTPLQNDLMELWSLMHFLMPHIFQSHQEFKDWFSNPISGMVEGQERVNKEVVDRLHNVLRPFLLRRLKRDVEKQLPMKHEHVIYCRLSRRQRNLYEDFIDSSETQATLASANFFGMISVIMQLRKVCNHPDLFEGRPIISSFDMAPLDIQLSSLVCSVLESSPFSFVNLSELGLVFTQHDYDMSSWEHGELEILKTPSEQVERRVDFDLTEPRYKIKSILADSCIFEKIRIAVMEERLKEAKERAAAIAWWNSLRCERKPMYSSSLRKLVCVSLPMEELIEHKVKRVDYMYSSALANAVLSPVERFVAMTDYVESFMFVIPAVRAPEPMCRCSRQYKSILWSSEYQKTCSEAIMPLVAPIRPAVVRRQLYFPDRRLVQFDCGKLQELALLLRKLKSEGHKALIFTQMTKMLDILESFINLYGYTYMRLDGSTQPEERQTLMQRFNTNPKIFLFILSTRSGGVGVNLVGADTVIFYDSDWNPAMDQQAQDRCHRIGQTREVHIYRLISESTIEENILKKANQKRALDQLVIQSGSYNTEFFVKLNPMELFSGHDSLTAPEKQPRSEEDVMVSNAEVEAALKYAEDEADYMALKRVEHEEAVENQEFTEETMGKLEDDEAGNDEDMKGDEPVAAETEVIAADPSPIEPVEEKALAFAGSEDDVDMLADVNEITKAAVAAGDVISSFENQLRPIDRYAIRFLEMWNPVIDNSGAEVVSNFEQTEWELDRIEKYKDEMEADIDEDEEPFVYEVWDTDVANKAYREQVEALAQHQLKEDLLAEAHLKEGECDANATIIVTTKSRKSKSKKNVKKGKFKSLKKGSLSSEIKALKEEPFSDSLDDSGFSDELPSPRWGIDRKRKAGRSTPCSEDDNYTKKNKKSKKGKEISNFTDSQQNEKRTMNGEIQVFNPATKQSNRSKIGGKISITYMPVKRTLIIKPEKMKKGNIWSRDCVPSPDAWLPQEDAIVCAVVHEYGPHWHLVSDILYGLTAGGKYRGRYRHPVHCCERYKELMQRYVLSSSENLASDKNSSISSMKTLLKVTEENVKTLLFIASEQTDHEFLLQRHFAALLNSVWRVTSRKQNGSVMSGRITSSDYEVNRKLRFRSTDESKSFLFSALLEADNFKPHNRESLSQNDEVEVSMEQMELTLTFTDDNVKETERMPNILRVFVPLADPIITPNSSIFDGHLKSSSSFVESRYRGNDSASSSYLKEDLKHRQQTRIQPSGKHSKKSKGNHVVITEPHNSLHAISSDFGSSEFCYPTDTIDLVGSFVEDPLENLGLTGLYVECMPDVVSGLDDFSVFSDNADVG